MPSAGFFVTLHPYITDMRKVIFILLGIGFIANCLALKPIVEKEIITDSIDSVLVDSIPEPSKDPVFLLETDTYHFGLIDTLRQDLEYHFDFCNDGLDTLVINRIITSPGVKLVEWNDDNKYSYDQGGSFRVSIDPNSIKGEFKKFVFIYSNTPTRKLTLSGTVLRPRY